MEHFQQAFKTFQASLIVNSLLAVELSPASQEILAYQILAKK